MNPIEKEAYILARSIIQRARDEHWPYLNLSPFFRGTEEIRNNFEHLANLTQLPSEIEQLEFCTEIELRGTRLADVNGLSGLPKLRRVHFLGIPACSEENLARISEIEDPDERTRELKDFLAKEILPEPPEVREGGPEFLVPEEGQITLRDISLSGVKDPDQELMQAECQRKVTALVQIAPQAQNVAPNLLSVAELYSELISQDAEAIGARTIWSIANSLEAIIEIHKNAKSHHRHCDELPPSVERHLDDLIQTHRVWFLGHPGARKIEERATRNRKSADFDTRFEASLAVVEAAEVSTSVDPQATVPARRNVIVAANRNNSGQAALNELEDWAWNFVTSICRKLWITVKNPPGGFVVHTIAATYLAQFVLGNEAALKSFAYNVMSQSPIWWDMLILTLKKFASGSE